MFTQLGVTQEWTKVLCGQGRRAVLGHIGEEIILSVCEEFDRSG